MNNPFSYRFQAPVKQLYSLPSSLFACWQKNEAGCGDTHICRYVYYSATATPGNRSVTIKCFNTTGIHLHILGHHAHQCKQGLYGGIWATIPASNCRDRRSLMNMLIPAMYHVQLYVQDFGTGCSGYDTAQVRIMYTPGYLYVPNAFCPGCSNNALRQFLPMGKGLSQYRLRIFNI